MINNLFLFGGAPRTGKSTAAKILAKEFMKMDFGIMKKSIQINIKK